MTVIEYQMCCDVSVFFSKSEWFFVDIWRFNDLQCGGRPQCWIFKIYSLRDLYRHAIMLHCARFRSYNSIRSWDITISGLEKTNARHIGILLPLSISTTSPHSACHSASGWQIWNFIQIGLSSPEIWYYIDFQDSGRYSTILLPVSDWLTSLSPEGQRLSANQIP